MLFVTRPPSAQSVYGLVDPIRDHAGDFKIIFLQHHHMAVAADAAIGEPDEAVLHAGLRKKLRCTMII